MEIADAIMEAGRHVAAWDVLLLRMGDTEITAGSIARLIVLVLALFWWAGLVRGWLAGRILGRFDVDAGTRYAIASVVRYLVLVLGMVLILQNAGIKLAALGVVAGAVGVGVGFGLQNIVSNFISGLIVMLERPIKVGDRIEVGTVEGVVKEISARRTTVVTSDNVAILIPNQKFIVDSVVNVAYLSQPVRLRVAASLAPEADAAVLERLLLEVAGASPHVLADPGPKVLLRAMGGPAHRFELAVWFRPQDIARDELASELNMALARAFAAQGVRYA